MFIQKCGVVSHPLCHGCCLTWDYFVKSYKFWLDLIIIANITKLWHLNQTTGWKWKLFQLIAKTMESVCFEASLINNEKISNENGGTEFRRKCDFFQSDWYLNDMASIW